VDLADYAARHTTAAPPHLKSIEAETRARLALPQMLSGVVVGRLLETLVHVMQPRLVLEIGTYSGGSALWMAGALCPGARLVTCELDPEHAAFAGRHIAAAGLLDRVEIVLGPALESIAALPGPYDLVFLDADKTGYLQYYEAVVPKLAPAVSSWPTTPCAAGRSWIRVATTRARRRSSPSTTASPRTRGSSRPSSPSATA